MIQILTALILTHPPVPHFEDVSVDLLAVTIGTEQPAVDDMSEDLAIAIYRASQAYDISPYFLAGVIRTESNFKPWVKGDCKDGRCKAKGLGQLHMIAARGRKSEITPCEAQGRCNEAALVCKRRHTMQCQKAIETNTLTTAWLISKLRRKYGKRAMVIYNCGGRCGRSLWTNTVRKYFRHYRRFKLVKAL